MKLKLFLIFLTLIFISTFLVSPHFKISETGGVGSVLLLFACAFIIIILGELYPWKTFNVEECTTGDVEFSNSENSLNRTGGGKSFVVHVHTCFSYDSLGKPKQLEIEAYREGINKVYTTDHENDLIGKVYPSDLISPGREIEDSTYGRLLILGNGLKVIAHPNNPKYRFTGRYEKDFFYEIIDLKDVIKIASFWAKLYFLLRTFILYFFNRKKALDYFPRLIPMEKWVEHYLKNTRGGTLKIIGGLDHHIKFSFWEKPKKFFSFPAYSDSFYILRNKTFGGEKDIDLAMKEGLFYISLCNTSLEIENGKVKTFYQNTLTVSYYSDGNKKVCLDGLFDPKAVLVVVYRYLFRFKNLFFGIRPIAVFKPFSKSF